MELNAVMSRGVYTVTSGATVREAAGLMKRHNIGILPICEDRRVVGVITDRDMAVRVTAEGKGPETPVGEVMTKEVICCPCSFDAREAVVMMKRGKIRRIIVVDMEHHPVGIVSLLDLARGMETSLLAGEVLMEMARSRLKKQPA